MKIMRGLVILAILVVATWAIEIDLKKTYNDAIEKLKYQFMKETLEGKVSSRFNRKKFTP